MGFNLQRSSCRNRAAAGCFYLVGAAAPIGMWSLVLFSAIPAGQEPLQHAAEFLVYVFAEAHTAWFYFALAVLPLTLLALAAMLLRQRSSSTALSMGFWTTAAVSAVAAAIACWPVVFTVAAGTYYAWKSNAGLIASQAKRF